MKLSIKKAFSVIGLGYGDEGKGVAVDYLASQNVNSVVIRHSGGHQVGHTVKIGNALHTFRHFGSGTLRGIDTIWSENCTVSPLQFEIEYKQIKNLFNLTPKLYYEALCPITTIYDIAYNRAKEKQFKTGSVGVGFGATLKRQEIVPLFAMDLKYKPILLEKLRNICSFYFKKVESEEIRDLYYNEIGELSNAGYTNDCFIQSCEFFINNTHEVNESDTYDFDTVIFEGNQGVLLDKYHGFYPNVTYAHTTNKNVKFDKLNTFYVSRCYATRHGYGYLKNENLNIPTLINTDFEQNHTTPYQDEFRIAMLDYDMVEYAIKCDQAYGKNKETNLLITCMDQYVNPKMTYNGEIINFSPAIFKPLVHNIFTNDSPESKTIKPWI